MSLSKSILEKNAAFLKERKPSPVKDSQPRKKLAIITCMDVRLQGFLQEAMGIENGDAIILTTAGNFLNYGEMRSVITAIYKFQIETLLVVGHEDCGMANLGVEDLKDNMIARGVNKDAIAEYDNIEKWLGCFKDERENVTKTVDIITSYSLTPPDLEVRGLFFHLSSGKLDLII